MKILDSCIPAVVISMASSVSPSPTTDVNKAACPVAAEACVRWECFCHKFSLDTPAQVSGG